MEKKVILKAENITKTFPGVKALSDVSFDLREGEVHILMGENGAGKSTLMKVFSGMYHPDSGRIIVNGDEVEIHSTDDSLRLGISIIYQEFNLVPDITVAQNIFLNREPVNRFGTIDFKKMNSEAEHYLSLVKSLIKPTDYVRSLGVAQQQLVEIAKALSQNARILIMDEPTAALSENEINTLFEIIKDLKKRGVGIIYISHRFQELDEIGDRVTILRDGRTISTDDKDRITVDEIIKRMVGREVSNKRVREKNTKTDKVALSVENLTRGKEVKDVSLTVNEGEIVAVAGLVGAGRTELVHAVFGIDKAESGSVYVYGVELGKRTPHKCIKSGMGLLSESRKENGLALTLPIRQNVTEANLEGVSSFGYLDTRKEEKTASDYIKLLDIVCPGSYQWPLYLSGGNQQKVVLAKWLFSNPKILIFDEPTRGIDVGAKNEIYRLMDSLASRGVSILMVSSDLLEIMTIADRVLVMREGRIVKDMPIEEASQERIASYAVGDENAE